MQAGTVMQLGPQLSALRAKHLLYVRAAGVPDGGATQAAGAFAGTLARLWTLQARTGAILGASLRPRLAKSPVKNAKS